MACTGSPAPWGPDLGREGQMLRLFAASASCAAQTVLHLDPTPSSQNDGCCCLVAEASWFGVARRVRLNSLSPGMDSSAFPSRLGWAWWRSSVQSRAQSRVGVRGRGAFPLSLSQATKVWASSVPPPPVSSPNCEALSPITSHRDEGAERLQELGYLCVLDSARPSVRRTSPVCGGPSAPLGRSG